MRFQRPLWLIRPGSVKRNQIPAWDERSVRGLELLDVLGELAGHDPKSTPHLLLSVELRRRENWIARWSLGLSFAAFIISVVALTLKR